MSYKNVLVSHSDQDGLLAIVLAIYFKLPFDKIVSYDYGFEEEEDLIQLLRDANCITVVDLSLTPELHDELLSKNKIVYVFDHHETSQWIAEKPNCVWDGSRCGTKLFFEEYILPSIGRYKPIVKELVELVDVYDRWVLDSPLRPMSEDLQRVFVKYGDWGIDDPLIRHDRFIKAMLRKLEKDDHFKWNIVELMYIQDAKRSEDRAYEEAMNMLQIRTDNKGRKFIVWASWGKISMVAHRILNIDKMAVDYAVILQKFHDKWGQVSFRSREGEFNLIDLAGVNGHKASAGASLTPEDAKRFLQENLCFRYKSDLIYDDEPIIEECKT